MMIGYLRTKDQSLPSYPPQAYNLSMEAGEQERFSSMAGLIARLTELDEYGYMQLWVSDVCEKLPEDVLEGLLSEPISSYSVLGFARALAGVISNEIGQCSDPEFYNDTKSRGHEALKLLHDVATSAGIDVGLEEIDTTLTPAEDLVAEGLAEVDSDGSVSITDLGNTLISGTFGPTREQLN